MNKINTFTSTGSKLIHHPLVVSRLKSGGYSSPLSLQIAPTSRCNLNCVFCSNVNRSSHEDLDVDRIMAFAFRMDFLGANTIEWTGGGDPLMYEHIKGVVHSVAGLGFQQGLITNGIKLKEFDNRFLDRFRWIRISLNGLDYGKDIKIPVIKGTMGFSYVMNANTNEKALDRLYECVRRYQPAYVRIVPNCQVSHEMQIKNNYKYSQWVKELGAPYFYQSKTFRTPESCYWGHFKPFILHDGYVYACSSVVLNAEADRSFHAKYRWCVMEEFEKVYREPMKSYPTENCSHCVFAEQNDQVADLLNPTGMEGFI